MMEVELMLLFVENRHRNDVEREMDIILLQSVSPREGMLLPLLWPCRERQTVRRRMD